MSESIKAIVRRVQCNGAVRTHLPPESLLETGVHDSDDCVVFAWGIERIGQNQHGVDISYAHQRVTRRGGAGAEQVRGNEPLARGGVL